MQKKSISWGLISILLIIFFPVGIYFIVKKMTSERFSYANNGRALRNLGFVLVALAALYAVMVLTGQIETSSGGNGVGVLITGLMIFGGGGALCIIKGNAYIKRGMKYSRYISVINSTDRLIIDNIASGVGTSCEQAAKDIEEMIAAGFFTNSYIDTKEQRLVMPEAAGALHPDFNSFCAVPADMAANNRTRAVKCPNCGATNTVLPNTKNECEYCGSAL